MCFARSSEDDVDDIDIKKGVDISLKIYTAIHFRSNSNSKVILDYGWIQQLLGISWVVSECMTRIDIHGH